MTSVHATPNTRRMNRRLCNAATSTAYVKRCRQTRVNVTKLEAVFPQLRTALRQQSATRLSIPASHYVLLIISDL
jgi:hypothetical protein